MSVANRKAARDALAQLLTAQVSSAQRVYPRTGVVGARITQPAAFGGESPVIVVASAGTARVPATFAGTRPVFYLTVYLFVRSAVQDADGNDVPASGVDDTLDDLESEIAQVLQANQRTAHWTALSYDGRSKAEFLTVIDGTEYKREQIPLVITGTS